MNDMERRKFEDSFQEAFKNAEATPSESVWTNIELDLEKADGDKMKRRLFFFKMLAAASIVFAMSFAGIGYYVFQRSDMGNLAQESTPISDQNKLKDETNASALQNDNASSSVEKTGPNASDSQTQSGAPAADDSQPGKDELSRQNPSVSPSTNNETQNGRNKNSTEGTTAKDAGPLIAADQNLNSAGTQTSSKSDGDDRTAGPAASPSATSSQIDPATSIAAGSVAADTTRELPVLYQPAEPKLKLPVSNADPGMLLLAKLAEEEKKYALEEKNQAKKKTENLWTSVGFAAGGVNANNPSVAPVPSNALYSMNSANTASTQSKASGVSYSVGVSVGTKISNRWVLQGGINYLTQNYDYTANSVVVVNNNFEAPKAASINAFSPQLLDAMSNTTVAQTFPYNVNNNVRFVNVPLQAGYLVVNRKFGFQLNAGVSTDVFLQNTITPDGGGLSKTTQGSGDGSPYRSLNFSGLMGTEFSYKLGDRYRLSLNPGLRYPFSSVYKSNTGVDSTPLTFDVGLRFRYIFH